MGLAVFPNPVKANTTHLGQAILVPQFPLLSARLWLEIWQAINSVIAVIGDGSLTGGQAYEALNHVGHLGTKLTVVLNDNEMSIGKNVGAMSEYLAKVRSDPTYSKVKHDVEYLLKRVPAIGDRLAKTAERVKGSLKYLVVPGVIFEELGFTYIGPIDGHNLVSLTEVLQKTKNIAGPVLVHVITCKGKGYAPAESFATDFMGSGRFALNLARW